MTDEVQLESFLIVAAAPVWAPLLLLYSLVAHLNDIRNGL